MLLPEPIKGGPKELIKYVKENPQCAEAWYYLGLFRFREERDIPGAKEAFKKAISCRKEYPDAHIAFADCLWAEMQKEEAIAQLGKALEILPEASIIHWRLGSFLRCKGELEKSAEYFKKALKFEKNDKETEKIREELKGIMNKLKTKKCPYCDHDIGLDKNLCQNPDCLRDIALCSKCNYPNQLFHNHCFLCKSPLSLYESWLARGDNYRSSYLSFAKPINTFRKMWFYPFRAPLNQDILPDIPPPVIAGDVVIIPNPDDLGMPKSFLGLNVNSGQSLWEWQVGQLLSYTCAPMPIKEFLYIPSHGYLRKRALNTENAQANAISADKEIKPSGYLQPLSCSYKNRSYIILNSDKSLFIYDLQNEQCKIVGMKFQKKGDNIAGIVWNGEEVLILSQKGEILSLGLNGKIQTLVSLKGNVKICSPPCSYKKDIFFEFMYENDSKRRICAFAQDNGTIIETELENEDGCTAEHFHWKFPPLINKDGILLTSDSYSQVYICKREDRILIKITKEIDISNGITNISQPYSAVMGKYLISSAGNLFFYADLDNSSEKGLMDTGSVIIAQPAVNQKGLLFFLCIDGLHCYEVV